MSSKQLDDAIKGFISHLQCAICLCTFVNPYSMPCNHCFCHECIVRSLKIKEACPICKAPCKKRNLREDVMVRNIVAGYRQFASLNSHCDVQDDEANLTGSYGGASVVPTRKKKAKINLLKQTIESMRESNGESPRSGGDHQTPSIPKRSRDDAFCSPLIDTISQNTICSDITTFESSIGDGKECIVSPFERNEPEQHPSPATVDADLNRSSLPHYTLAIDDTLNAGVGAKDESITIHESKYPVRPVGSLAIDLKYDEIMYDTTPEKSSNNPSHKEAQAPSPKASSKIVERSRRKLRRPRHPSPRTIILCSGFTPERLNTIQKWTEQIGAEITSTWCTSVTHLIVQCATVSSKNCIQESIIRPNATSNSQKRRYVKKRSLKYLKALAGGRWIVSDEWLQACAKRRKRVDERDYEVFGYLKAKHAESPVQMCRHRREMYLKQESPAKDTSFIGSKLFSSFCHFFIGTFMSPLPPQTEIDMLLRIGDSHRIQSLEKMENIDSIEGRQLLIVCNEANPRSLLEAATTQKSLEVQHGIHSLIVSYLWIFDSVTYGTLQPISDKLGENSVTIRI